jgi:zinc transport system substrate-binding protein
MRLPLIAIFVAALAAAPLRADPPRVVTDIAPVQALAAQVMDGVGPTPDLLLTPGISPHDAALRPSQARMLQAAGLVIWVGPDLTPWLGRALDNLAPDADGLALLDAPETRRLPYRDLDAGEHEGDHADDHADDHGHEGDHDHAGTDPHAWLDPQNGAIWLGLIAERLAGIDPDNADRYRANARDGQARLAALETDLGLRLAPVRDRPFIAQHDAYQYFETRFGLTLAATVAPGAATDAGPARLTRLHALVAEQGIRCAFREPQFGDGALRVATEGTGVTLSVLDPLGSALASGPGFYAALLTDIADTIAGCAGD